MNEDLGDDFEMPFGVRLTDDDTYPKWDDCGFRARAPHHKMAGTTATTLEMDRDRFIGWLKKQGAIIKFDVRKRGELHFLKINDYKVKKRVEIGE